MNSIATGMMPWPMIAETQAPGRLAGIEADHHRPRALGLAQDAQGRLGHDAELALRADDERQKIDSPPDRDAGPPNSTMSPFIITIFRPRTLLVVTPYFRQWAPPEFMAILPPMVQASWLDGSGA